MGRGARIVALVASMAAILDSCVAAPLNVVPSALGPAAIAAGRDHASTLDLITPGAGFEPPSPGLLQKVVLPEPSGPLPAPTRPAASIAMKHVWQSLNNCGPASVVIILSSLGIQADQESARLALRGPSWARGMGPAPVDPWVAERFGLRATWRNNGTRELMKALISNGFAPMVTQWAEDPRVSRIAHWRVLQGYDDGRGVFISYDPLRGRIPLTYEWSDRNWQPFSYRWLVIHRPDQEPLLRAIVGADWSEAASRERLALRARSEALAQDDSQGWLAFGEAAYLSGGYADAVAAFERGLALGSGKGVTGLRTSYTASLRAVGRWADAARADAELANNDPVATTLPSAEVIARDEAREAARALRGALSE